MEQERHLRTVRSRWRSCRSWAWGQIQTHSVKHFSTQFGPLTATCPCRRFWHTSLLLRSIRRHYFFDPSLKGLIPFCPWKHCRTDHSLTCLQAWSRTPDEELCLRTDTCSLPLECTTRDGKEPLHPTCDHRAPPLATPAFPWCSVLQSDADCGPWPQHGTTLQKCQTQVWAVHKRWFWVLYYL